MWGRGLGDYVRGAPCAFGRWTKSTRTGWSRFIQTVTVGPLVETLLSVSVSQVDMTHVSASLILCIHMQHSEMKKILCEGLRSCVCE